MYLGACTGLLCVNGQLTNQQVWLCSWCCVVVFKIHAPSYNFQMQLFCQQLHSFKTNRFNCVIATCTVWLLVCLTFKAKEELHLESVLRCIIYAGCPSFRGINVSTFKCKNLVLTYNSFLNKNIWTYISSLYFIIITHYWCADRLNPDWFRTGSLTNQTPVFVVTIANLGIYNQLPKILSLKCHRIIVLF